MTKSKVLKEITPTKGSPWVLGFVIIYTSLQVLIPLRHFLYKRDVQWTHEGSNFSWRMMADRRETNVSITVEDPLTKDVYDHSPDTLLNNKQLTMANTPYMLFQYVQFLKQFLQTDIKTPIKNPIIRADIQVSLNGKPFQYMFDPACNLSDVTYSPFKDLPWVLPLKP